MPKLVRFFVFGRKSDATPLAALLLGAFIYCAFAASHHALEASIPHPAEMPVQDADAVLSLQLSSLSDAPLLPPPAATLDPIRPQNQIQAAPTNDPPPAMLLTVQRTAELASVFDSRDYSLDDIRSGEKAVPPLTLTRLPQDLGKTPEVEKRKELFIQALLPIVLQVNESITADRIRLRWLREAMEQKAPIASEDRAWLDDLADRYQGGDATVADLDELLKRVDVVPPSLAIAQAITESGWGTSYPARVGNALFGVFHFAARSGNTAVGGNKPGTFQMRAYDNLSDAVSAYTLNLNTHPAYAAFRDQRAKLRHTGEGLDGYTLASTLLRYSELGMQYINVVRLIMRTENLKPLDEARLDRAEPL